MQLRAPGEQQHGGDGYRDRDPMRQRERGGAKQISQHVEHRHDDADVDVVVVRVLRRWLFVVGDVSGVVDDEPGAED